MDNHETKTVDISGMSAPDKLRELSYGIQMSSYALAQLYEQDSFIQIQAKLLQMQSLIQNIIVLSHKGDKELYEKCRHHLKHEIKMLISAHDTFIEEIIKENKQSLN